MPRQVSYCHNITSSLLIIFSNGVKFPFILLLAPSEMLSVIFRIESQTIIEDRTYAIGSGFDIRLAVYSFDDASSSPGGRMRVDYKWLCCQRWWKDS